MWTKSLFNTEKPVIGMLHLLAMPTDPKYDPEGGMDKVFNRAKKDMHALQNGGIDAILFCNEFSIPYLESVNPITIACMASIIGELKSELKVPFGVDVGVDPYKVFDLAASVKAPFVRETFTGVYAGEYGISNHEIGKIERHRVDVGCKNVRTLATLVPEGCKPLVDRPIEDVAKSTVFCAEPDALLVYGLTAGRPIDNELIPRVKAVVDTPVFASNGVREDSVAATLAVADGCIVGTWLKVDGKFFNETDEVRVSALMKKAREVRGD